MSPPLSFLLSSRVLQRGVPHDRADEPCWGEVEVIDEERTEDDSWWVHACQGHKGLHEGHPYEPEVQVDEVRA